jgi:hypothetical protein
MSERFLDTAAAAAWLTDRGVRRTPATLRKLRVTGGGPRYRHLNKRAYYTATDLAAWLEERLSPPRSNSGEAPAAIAAKPAE